MPPFVVFILAVTVLVLGCRASGPEPVLDEVALYQAFAEPLRVEIRGYKGDAMEPFVSRDGRYLFFNNRNDPAVNTDLHLAERIDSLTFTYLGPLDGVNTPALEGVPTMDRAGTLYFVSPRSYEETFSTLYQGRFADGAVSGVRLVPGVSRAEPRIVNFDVEVSPDGGTLYFVDARFGEAGPEAADLVIARRVGDRFERAPDSDALLRDVNTEALEYAAAISEDGLELFFNRMESITAVVPPAIYRAARSRPDEPFGPPQRVAAMAGFVEGATYDRDGKAVYYHKRVGDRFVLYRAHR